MKLYIYESFYVINPKIDRSTPVNKQMGSTMKPTMSCTHVREDIRRASSSVRPDPEHLDVTDQCSLRDGNVDSHESGMVELAIQIPRA